MKQRLIRVMAIGLLAVGSIAADVARTHDGRLAVDLPAGWQVVRSAKADPVQARSTAKDAYVEIYAVAKADHPGMTLRQWMDACRATSERTSRLTDRSSDDPRPVTISARPGFVCSVVGTLNGQRRVYVKSYVETDQQFAEVMCWTTPTHADAADGDFHFLADHVRDAVPVGDLPGPP